MTREDPPGSGVGRSPSTSTSLGSVLGMLLVGGVSLGILALLGPFFYVAILAADGGSSVPLIVLAAVAIIVVITALSLGIVALARAWKSRTRWSVTGSVLLVIGLGTVGLAVARGQSTTPSFRGPSGIAVDPQGRVYVADSFHHRVVKLSSEGKVVGTWGYTRHGTDYYCDPGSVAVSAGGTIYLSTCVGHAVLVLSPGLKLLARWHVSDPSGIAVDAQGNVYVSHTHTPAISVFSPTGTLLRSWNRQTFGKRNASLAVDRHGNVYVADDNLDTMQVQKYSPSGRLLAQWGTFGHKRGQFTSANGVAVDQHDKVYVTDGSGDRLEKFSPTGKVVAVFGNLSTADGVAVDAQGTIYVTCDFINSVFKLSPSGEELARWG